MPLQTWEKESAQTMGQLLDSRNSLLGSQQLSGYRELLPVLPRDVIAVTLCSDGRYDITPFTDKELDAERRHFLAAVSVARRLREWGIRK